MPLSRLERTPIAGSPDLFEATKIPFAVELGVTNLPPLTVTSHYPSNDIDGDSWPETQPWRGATYVLDNCPTVPNTLQLDRDANGAGDACDEQEKRVKGTLTWNDTFTDVGSAPGTYGARMESSGSMELSLEGPDPSGAFVDDGTSSFASSHLLQTWFPVNTGCTSGALDGEQRVEPVSGVWAQMPNFPDPVMRLVVVGDLVRLTVSAPKVNLFNTVGYLVYSEEGGCVGMRYENNIIVTRAPMPLLAGRYLEGRVRRDATGRVLAYDFTRSYTGFYQVSGELFPP